MNFYVNEHPAFSLFFRLLLLLWLTQPEKPFGNRGKLFLPSGTLRRRTDNPSPKLTGVIREAPRNEIRIFLFSAQTAQKAKWRGKGKLDCFSAEIFIKYSNDIQISYASERREMLRSGIGSARMIRVCLQAHCLRSLSLSFFQHKFRICSKNRPRGFRSNPSASITESFRAVTVQIALSKAKLRNETLPQQTVEIRGDECRQHLPSD